MSTLLSLVQQFDHHNDQALSEKKKQFIDFISKHPECFHRTCMPGHLTASAFLLNPNKTHALLMHHKKLDLWIQPGGHADGETHLLNVAIKEAKEESGLENIIPLSNEIFDLDIHLVPAFGHEPEHLHFDVRFLLQSLDVLPATGNHESHAVSWYSLSDFEQHNLEPSVYRLFKRFDVIAQSSESFA